ncbi:MAG: HI0074 family nucleotidyltransferase substrate-binding subunit [Caulobacteraceae bacterium]
MPDKYGLKKDIFYKIIDIFKDYSPYIKESVLYGSRARGDYKPGSDIDIAIKFRKNNEKIYEIRDKLLEQNIIYTFDVIDYGGIKNEKLKKYIDEEGSVIFMTDSEGRVIPNMNKIEDKVEVLEKAVQKLKESLERDYSKDDIVIDAVIQRFEFTYELSWKLMKAYLEYLGNVEGSNPRSAIQQSFREGIITDGEPWLQMLQDRNLTSHTYDEATALMIYDQIKNSYLEVFEKFLDNIRQRINV